MSDTAIIRAALLQYRARLLAKGRQMRDWDWEAVRRIEHLLAGRYKA